MQNDWSSFSPLKTVYSTIRTENQINCFPFMYSVRIYFFMITNNKYYFNSINYNLIISLENLLINSKGFIILFKVLVDKAIGYN